MLSRDDVLPNDAFLVKAHAVTPTSFEIDHVFIGDGDLKDKIFSGELYYYTPLDFNKGRTRVPRPVKRDTLGIWWIKKEKGKLVSVHGQLSAVLKKTANGSFVAVEGQFHYPDELVFLPALNDGSKAGQTRYEMAVAQAEVFEKIYRADDESRLKVIDDYVHSRDSVRGAAALMSLAWINMPKKGIPLRDQRPKKYTRIAEYVLPFAEDDSLTPCIQRQVEKLLAANVEGFWKGSPDQRKMFDRWFTGAWKEKENVPWEASEEKVLVEFMETRPLNALGRLELAVGGIANPARSERFKDEMVTRLKGIEKIVRTLHPKQDEEGYAYLVRVIRNEPAPSKKNAAAKLLTVYTPFSPQRWAAVNGFLPAIRDDDVRREVGRALTEK